VCNPKRGPYSVKYCGFSRDTLMRPNIPKKFRTQSLDSVRFCYNEWQCVCGPTNLQVSSSSPRVLCLSIVLAPIGNIQHYIYGFYYIYGWYIQYYPYMAAGLWAMFLVQSQNRTTALNLRTSICKHLNCSCQINLYIFCEFNKEMWQKAYNFHEQDQH